MLLIYLTFRGPYIVYSCNESQQDVLFLNFILVKNSMCLGQSILTSLADMQHKLLTYSLHGAESFLRS